MMLQNIVAVATGLISLALALLGLAVVYLIFRNRIDLSGVLSEGGDSPKASLSRLQMLIFTFAVAGVWLATSFENGTLVDIPNSVLGALGISGGSYLLSKGIGNAGKK